MPKPSMPKKSMMAKKKSYMAKKRPYYKKSTPYRQRLVLSGFPQTKLVKMRYVDQNATLDPGAGLIQSTSYSCNSLYDPDISATGHQPMGFDQWSKIYRRYTVLSSKITVRWNPVNGGSTTTNVQPCYFGIMLDEPGGVGTSSFSTINNLLESRFSAGYKTGGVVASANNRKYVFPYCVKYFNSKKYFGSRFTIDDDLVSGKMGDFGTGASPGSEPRFVVWACSIDGNDPGSASLTVEIDYIALLRVPLPIDGS